MKNPNGYGSVFKLGGKRRRPWAVRVTAGWKIVNGKARQVYDYISYHEGRGEAMIALADYNKDPYDVDVRKITFAELYKDFSKEKFKIGTKDEASKSTINGYTTAFNNSTEIHDIPFYELKTHHMQGVIDESGLGYSGKNQFRVLYSQMYKYALKNDIVEKNYAAFLTIPADKEESKSKPFADKSIALLWDNLETQEIADCALIMIYSGLRIGELLLLPKSSIKLNERFLKGGLKTDAGKNRVVPINKKIIPLLEKRLNTDSEHLITNERGGKMDYQAFRRRWLKMMDELKLDHHTHDCRHTFGTLMDNANANNVARKRIMGHAIPDVTDGVYTHKDLDQLLKAVDLI